MKIIYIMLFAALLCPCADDALKVMTFNVRLGVADDGENSWPMRKDAVAAMLEDRNPAVFGVQEAYDFQLDCLLEKCSRYKCVGVGRDDGIHGGEHMSVFYDTTRVTLEDWGTYWLSETPDRPSLGWDAACRRTATWALLRAGKRHFYFVNTHLDHVGVDARHNGLALVVERIGAMNPEGYPIILCGDFNSFADDPCLWDLRDIMSDAWETAALADDGPTYHDWGKKTDIGHIDYIFYSGFKACRSIQREKEEYLGRPFLSDHYPVTAVLEW